MHWLTIKCSSYSTDNIIIEKWESDRVGQGTKYCSVNGYSAVMHHRMSSNHNNRVCLTTAYSKILLQDLASQTGEPFCSIIHDVWQPPWGMCCTGLYYYVHSDIYILCNILSKCTQHHCCDFPHHNSHCGELYTNANATQVQAIARGDQAPL
jgi:hypothetical protein